MPAAPEPQPGSTQPYIPASEEVPELTPVPLLVGALLGMVFGASSAYLVLKVSMTVSASIPVAVLSITLFRGFSKLFGLRKATILENNITQTTGSAGESIAFGVGATMPALLIMGYDLEPQGVLLVSVLGGLLGILMMIPLRRALIVHEAKTLVYPEGTACAEVLISGEKGGTTARTVFAGLGVGGLFALARKAFGLFKDTPEKIFGKWYDGGNLSLEAGPELLGVGYLIGTDISLMMGAGGILAALVLMPAIKLFGSAAAAPIYPATKLIAEMTPSELWDQYVLYIGAGAVASGGIISLFKSLPTIAGGAVRGLQNLRSSGAALTRPLRTERDLPMWVVGAGALVLVLACTFAPSLKINLLGALLILVFGFLFVTVSSRLTGEVGSSSNPISGMTVATLLLTSLLFLALGWVSAPYKVAALSVAAIVCIAASNGGTTSQDLKTGYLVGATPARQQIAILVGTLSSALLIGYVILALNDAGTVCAARSYPNFVADTSTLPRGHLHGPDASKDAKEYYVLRLREPTQGVPAGKYLVDDGGHIKYLEDPGINGSVRVHDDGRPAPKLAPALATLMAFIIDGIMSQKLPWGLVLLGVFISIVLELCGLSSLAFAVGVYLPVSTSTPIMLGGLVRWLADKTARKQRTAAEAESGPGVLFSSGLIAGASIVGMVVAMMQISDTTRGWLERMSLSALIPRFAESDLASFLLFCALGAVLYLVANEWLLREGARKEA
jgi:putative OPT family oligopeptide transporter